VYRGKLRNWGKTRKALRPVHIPKELADDLWLWRQECKNPSPEAFIFPSPSGGFIDLQNYRKMRHSRLATTTDVYTQEIPGECEGDGGGHQQGTEA